MTSAKDDRQSPITGKQPANGGGASGGAKSTHSKNKDMGAALRSVYQKTVEEVVPADLISLLGKLD